MCPDQTFRCCGDGAGPGWLPAVPAGAERGCHTRFLGRRHPTGRGAVPARRLVGCGPTGGRPGRTWPRGGRAGVPGSSAGRAEPSALRGHCHGQPAAPPLLAALPGAVTLAATRFSWLSHKTETGCAAPSGFCTGRDLCRPWGPQLSAVARGPLAAPRGVFPGPAVGGAAAQDAQALGKPARPPPAARRRGAQAQSGFLALGRCPLLAGFEAFFFLVTCLALHCVRLGD